VTYIDEIHVGDCRATMRQMITAGVRVNCIVTSPPYWGLRDYGVKGQFGLERTWLRHVARMRGTFRLARELLTDDGTLWMNYGDSYNTTRQGGAVGHNSTINGQRTQEEFRKASRAMKSRISPPDIDGPNRRAQRGLKPKDLVGMPWRVAFALQASGWYLRSDIIWHKPNPMPESIRDRPTKSHEYLFLLARSERYHYDASAISEPVTGNAHARGDGVNPKAKVVPAGWATGTGRHDAVAHAKESGGGAASTKFGKNRAPRSKQNDSMSAAVTELVEKRNARTVWTIPSAPFSAAHFATFPRDLVRRCILAGSRPGDTVFDPFMGSGTVAEVALELGRHYIGCELNPEYAAMFKSHRSQQVGMGI
jgi:DNA modification methylase